AGADRSGDYQGGIAHVPEKWTPAFRIGHAPSKNQSCSLPGRGRGSGTLPRTMAFAMRGRGCGSGIGPAIGSLAPPGTCGHTSAVASCGAVVVAGDDKARPALPGMTAASGTDHAGADGGGGGGGAAWPVVSLTGSGAGAGAAGGSAATVAGSACG